VHNLFWPCSALTKFSCCRIPRGQKVSLKSRRGIISRYRLLQSCALGTISSRAVRRAILPYRLGTRVVSWYVRRAQGSSVIAKPMRSVLSALKYTAPSERTSSISFSPPVDNRQKVGAVLPRKKCEQYAEVEPHGQLIPGIFL